MKKQALTGKLPAAAFVEFEASAHGSVFSQMPRAVTFFIAHVQSALADALLQTARTSGKPLQHYVCRPIVSDFSYQNKRLAIAFEIACAESLEHVIAATERATFQYVSGARKIRIERLKNKFALILFYS